MLKQEIEAEEADEKTPLAGEDDKVNKTISFILPSTFKVDHNS